MSSVKNKNDSASSRTRRRVASSERKVQGRLFISEQRFVKTTLRVHENKPHTRRDTHRSFPAATSLGVCDVTMGQMPLPCCPPHPPTPSQTYTCTFQQSSSFSRKFQLEGKRIRIKRRCFLEIYRGFFLSFFLFFFCTINHVIPLQWSLKVAVMLGPRVARHKGGHFLLSLLLL